MGRRGGRSTRTSPPPRETHAERLPRTPHRASPPPTRPLRPRTGRLLRSQPPTLQRAAPQGCGPGSREGRPSPARASTAWPLPPPPAILPRTRAAQTPQTPEARLPVPPSLHQEATGRARILSIVKRSAVTGRVVVATLIAASVLVAAACSGDPDGPGTGGATAEPDTPIAAAETTESQTRRPKPPLRRPHHQPPRRRPPPPHHQPPSRPPPHHQPPRRRPPPPHHQPPRRPQSRRPRPRCRAPRPPSISWGQCPTPRGWESS